MYLEASPGVKESARAPARVPGGVGQPGVGPADAGPVGGHGPVSDGLVAGTSVPKALEHLFGHGRFVPWYRSIWVCLTFLGSMLSLETVWTFLDVCLGSMVLPNLIGLLGLSGIVAAETRGYFAERR